MLKRSLMQIFTKMRSPPPPMPWITLPASSMLILILKAAISDPKKKTILAVRRMGFRPNMSLIFPHVGVDAAAASKYAEPTQV